MSRRILVTGGAGYIGSHVVAALLDYGDEPVVFDHLHQGHRQAVPEGVRLIEADLADAEAVDRVLSKGRWHSVMHFAALAQVGESVALPLRYLAENAANSFWLIEACVRHGVSRFVFSSTANIFGVGVEIPISEDAPIAPASPYGESKRMVERALELAGRAHGLRTACLRYFNAAGADPRGRLGEDHRPEMRLIPLAIDAALGRRPELTVFGTDYPTPDGTCVRDYVHVTDLAEAHLRALERLDESSVVYNLGNGAGHSVMEVIRAVEAASGRTVPLRVGTRRPGDPPVLVASSARIRRETGWNPRYPDLADIVRTAYAWRVAHPKGYHQ